MYGAERATLDLAIGLARRSDLEVCAILIRESRLGTSESAMDVAYRDGISELYYLDAHSAFSFSQVGRLKEICQECKPDVLHSVGYKPDILGRLALRGSSSVKHVSVVHGWLFRPNIKEHIYGWLNVLALRRMDAVVVLSTYYHGYLLKKKIRSEKLAHIPTGIEREELGPDHDPAPGAFCIGICGRLSEEKNHEWLFRVLARPECSDVRCLVAGDGPLREHLEKRATELNVSDRVTFLGFVDRATFYARINVLVICSVMENLPYTVMEAMALKRSVIAVAVGGLPDLVDDPETGWLIPLNDDSQLAQAISEARDDASATSHKGALGYKKWVKEFNRDAMIEAYAALYATLCETKLLDSSTQGRVSK